MHSIPMAAFKFLVLLLTLLAVQLSEATRPSLFSSKNDFPLFNSTQWAVLVAGSSGYFNYRHQADICHAYQILKRGGLKDENIIVFMYDDIANNKMNPRPGVIINSPNGSDVYAGVPKDYTGEQVTAANFYAVLLGNASALTGGSGKVVASGPFDTVFVYYADHGGPGILGMPNMPYIYANDFIKVLETKHAMATYSEMVKSRTLNNNSTYGSHVMQYGTQRISNETVSVYQGSCPNSSLTVNPSQSFDMGVVDQREADLYSMWHTYQKLTLEPQEKEELLKNIKEITAHREHLDSSVVTINSQLLGDLQHGSVRGGGWALVDDWDCLKSMEAMDEAAQAACSSYNMGHWDPAIVGYSA
ncbi:hypothetical protein L1987_73456 [Smallanthus sonchifolius]|uniref:Uncharacterized protein n=1 Tax=Smallanthus sonchifolius TaxID=185202 RepID=A0ACB9A4S9_9ASTR|nr:hypothetical protein L1987_73456 [Smallanthus sonchifolius]